MSPTLLLLDPGGDNSFVVIIHALGHCFGVAGRVERLPWDAMSQVVEARQELWIPDFIASDHSPTFRHKVYKYTNRLIVEDM